jgi:DNA-directed RNA polymerase alpha subunit
MPPAKKTARVCSKSHRYLKSSDCPVCPVCEKIRESKSACVFPLGAPARRALENAGIVSLHQLAGYSENEILALHGMGKTSIPKLKKALQEAGLRFLQPGRSQK